jgi:tripartite-type tricarboxylate transporter receptor subunit TctC
MTSIDRRDFCKSVLLGSAAAASAFTLPALAQADYPNRPVRFILPFAAGGVADVTSRLVAENLGNKLGQRFVVENMPGAGGISAARAALAGGKDGYTLALLTNGNAISVPLFKSLPFDPVKDFVPISNIGTFDCMFIVNASSPYKTLPDLLKAMHDQPGKLNVGTITAGSTQNLTAELFKSMTKANFVIVPFRTSGEAVIGLLRNDIQVVVDFYAAVKPGLQDGKTRALAWSGPKSSAIMPDVPPAAQAGVPGFEVVSWNAMYAPAGTPQPIIDKLNGALRDVLADAELKKKALDFGITISSSTPAEADARMKSDIKKWTDVIEKAHIQKQ